MQATIQTGNRTTMQDGTEVVNSMNGVFPDIHMVSEIDWQTPNRKRWKLTLQGRSI